MQRALELGRQGDPSPNPHVGCVIAQGDKIVGEGHHASAGGEHAEVTALKAAGAAARGATLYATLEPCNHVGKTPPCVDAILEAGIKRVVVGRRDPNPRVTGGGIERLEKAGVEVKLGVLDRECKELIRPWSHFITTGKSYLSLKLAVSLDGRIATRTGASKWITCQESRARVHQLRGQHDAVMLGVNTVLTVLNAFTTELFPTRFRGAAFAWSNNLIGRIGYCLSPIAVGALIPRFGWGTTLAATTAFPLLALLLIWFTLPETRGRELEETAQL